MQRNCVAKLHPYVLVKRGEGESQIVYGETTTSRLGSLVKDSSHHGHTYRGTLLARPRESQNARCGFLHGEQAEWKRSIHASYLLRTPLSSEERTT